MNLQMQKLKKMRSLVFVFPRNRRELELLINALKKKKKNISDSRQWLLLSAQLFHTGGLVVCGLMLLKAMLKSVLLS